MESFLGLKKLQEQLEKDLGIKRGYDTIKLKSALRLIYDSSRQRIVHVADSMIRGMIRDDEDQMPVLIPQAKEPDLPEKEVWDFRLGDAVTVKLSRQDFKWMQKRTLGWSEKLNQIYGRVGFINNVGNEFDASISVYFPEEYAGRTLYAGVLKKVASPEYKDLYPRWKVGDYVETLSCKKTLRLLQRGLDQLPDKLIRVKGRVVAVTHPCILVTFDEKKTYDLKSASLVESKDKSPILKEEVTHARGFKVGERVKIISNVKKLIDNQKGHGGWNSAMCDIIGKMATIVHIQEDGNVLLRTEYCREWRLNPDSILHLEEEEIEEKDLEFLPRDIVKVLLPNNIRAILAMAELPMVFLEFLRAVAILPLVDDDLNYYIRFNADQHIQIEEKLLRKAKKSEKQEYESIEKKLKELKAGDKVHLDIGPPNYVQAMIRELHLHPIVAMAMVKSATLIGFINSHTAIIEYENGAKFRVKKKYLTVPDKFCVDESNDVLSLSVVNLIYDAIKKSVKDIHSTENAPNEDWKVNATFMSRGCPPCVEYKIDSTVATFKAVYNWLDKHSGWGVESLDEGQFMLQKIQGYEQEVKVGIIFNDEESLFGAENTYFGREVIASSFEEHTVVKQEAGPLRANDDGDRLRAEEGPVRGGRLPGEPLVDRGVRRPAEEHLVQGANVDQQRAGEGSIHGGVRGPPEEPPAHRGVRRSADEFPGLDSVRPFKYLKLHAESLEQDVYIPYVVRGQAQVPVQPTANNDKNPNNLIE